MKILILSRYGQLGASSRIRSYQYIPYLRAMGIDVNIAPLMGDHYLSNLYAGRNKQLVAAFAAYFRRLLYLLMSYQYDLLWIEKELFPWLPAWVEVLLERIGLPYVVDYDDALFHRYDMHPQKLVRSLLSSKISKVMRSAALVIVGNDYLADYAWRMGAKRVEYLPTVVDLERYKISSYSEDNVFSIGWIGSPTTARYLNLIRPALARVCRDCNSRLVIVGSGHIEFPDLPIEIHSWSEKTEVNEIGSFDVGIMPLSDEPWERGKCGYKLIQYMACGRPVVASPVGVNQQIVEEGVNGFLAETTVEWVKALKTLRRDPELRKRMGMNGRNNVEKKYCLQVAAPRLVTLLQSVIKA